MTLPPIDQTPTVVVRFTKKASERLLHLCEKRFKESGLLVLSRHSCGSNNDKNKSNSSSSSSNDGKIIILLTTTHAVLEAQAERIHLMKRTIDTRVMEYFSSKEKHRFRNVDDIGNLSKLKKNNNNNNSNVPKRHFDREGIFTSRDRAFLTSRLVKQVTVLDDGQERNELSEFLFSEYQASSRLHNVMDASNSRSFSSFVEDDENDDNVVEHGEKSDTLWHVLTSLDLIDVVEAVHQPALRDMVVAETTLAPFWKVQPPVNLIQDYFGYEVGFYFAWIGFLTQWYFFPGILGLLVYAFRIYRGDTIDTDEYTPFYGLVCFLWAVLFLRFWEREENRLAYQWGTFSLSNFERQKFFEKRPEFRGVLRKSPITGEYETYYPPFRRRLSYVFSAMVTVCMLVVAFAVMILSLNLQGYINPNNNPERWGNGNYHPFHSPYLADLAEEGNIFNAKSTFRSLIPVVIHVACISTLNGIYRKIAEKLTEMENHETEVDHVNSIVLKRFLFEAFDCYVALFYLAFYERNVDRLRSELVSVFQIDTLRRVLLECVVPMIMQSYKYGHFVLPRTWNSFTHRPPTLDDVLEDLDKDDYEQFDDYMEILIQMGYVTLFASAYPLASLIGIFANWIEIRTDAVKLSRLVRRPAIHRATGIGMWRTLMASIVWMSALTNCLLTGFTSDQLMHYLPSFYQITETGYSNMGHEKGWVLVFVIFGLERVLLVIGLLIYAIVPAVPEDIQEQLERRQYLRMQAMDDKAKKEKKLD